MDIFLCVLVPTCFCFLLFKPKGECVKGEYTLLLTVPVEYAECFEEGASLLDAVGKGQCGAVYETKVTETFSETSQGIFPVETHKRLFVTVRGDAKAEGASLRFGTLTPLPGKSVFLHLPCVCEGVCLSVRPIEEERI